MTVLILFATVEGQTAKIARFARDEVQKTGHDVVMSNASDMNAEVELDGIDQVILAAPVHERRHPRPFEMLITALRKDLSALPTMLISVSLSAAFPEGLSEARDYLTEMKMRTEFKPDVELLVAGAVRTQSYDYFASQVMRHVVLRGRDYDPNQGEHEFTDWDDLAKQIDVFMNAKTPA